MQTTLSPLLGSYNAQDCEFLLQTVDAHFLSIEEKEKQIQSGQCHYSDVLNKESKPSEQYQQLFLNFTEQYKQTLAEHVFKLARTIHHNQSGDIVLLSLARAGTPIGVLLKRALERFFKRTVTHYAISIIRDRGIDTVALDYLLKIKQYNATSLVFIDGWTAKGVITRELKSSVLSYNHQHNTNIQPALYVISDTGGVADFCATKEDYPIPSSMLNSTVSGLISRSLWRDANLNAFHGCVINEHLRAADQSQWFVDEISACFSDSMLTKINPLSPHSNMPEADLKNKMDGFISSIKQQYGIEDVNYIKPGIAEATRVMLRRVPSLLIVRSKRCEKVAHLLMLAKEKGVTVQVDPSLLFEACALIKLINTEN
ncbi:cysteine protease StiP family protein [Vibrio sagamiensis]|uniref:Uncharacterized protein n=1 Tax=Vibrio sagamiensis NBRC 104589 TaxID=1219064 RepID=A0A511QCU2_9VIBR|nr:cysteine protease StiP family protein [Vibrio sagamiensis]PNQ54463.1 hypothetical protein C1141_15750 [Vibrio agarivorans]GEM75118.1 hypothetical protein VSA01S_12300 [Vibrio sagamiensis NBRC 104589]